MRPGDLRTRATCRIHWHSIGYPNHTSHAFPSKRALAFALAFFEPEFALAFALRLHLHVRLHVHLHVRLQWQVHLHLQLHLHLHLHPHLQSQTGRKTDRKLTQTFAKIRSNWIGQHWIGPVRAESGSDPILGGSNCKRLFFVFLLLKNVSF